MSNHTATAAQAVAPVANSNATSVAAKANATAAQVNVSKAMSNHTAVANFGASNANRSTANGTAQPDALEGKRSPGVGMITALRQEAPAGWQQEGFNPEVTEFLAEAFPDFPEGM